MYIVAHLLTFVKYLNELECHEGLVLTLKLHLKRPIYQPKMDTELSKEIASLFDEKNDLLPFSLESVSKIPEYGSILYAVFLDKKEFIYIGIGGVAGSTARSRDPRSRIREHTSGRRSGDQFCIYIQDFYVIPTLLNDDYRPQKGHIDRLVKEFVQSRLSFRFVVFQTEDSNQIVRRLEREIQEGMHLNRKPSINGH